MLYTLAKIISFTCAMQLWVFNFGIRLFGYDIFNIIFFISSIFYFISHPLKPIPKIIKVFLFLIWGYFSIQVLSGFLIFSSSDFVLGFEQYTKKILSETFRTFFYTSFVLFLVQMPVFKRYAIIKYFIYGAVFSSLYGIAHIVLLVGYNINIDHYIWQPISYNADNFNEVITWSVMGIPRGKGFSGVNLSGTYYLMVIPLLFYLTIIPSKNISKEIFSSKKAFFLLAIVILGLLVTMSRTGIITSIIAMIAVILSGKISLKKTMAFILVGVVSAIITISYYSDYIDAILESRGSLSTERYALYRGGLELFTNNPLGIGLSNYSIVRFSLPANFHHDFNLHSSWFTVLVELGAIGFIFLFGSFIYILKKSWDSKSGLSLPFAASFSSLLLAGAFNQLFDVFSFYLYIILFFTTIVLDNQNRLQSFSHKLRPDK